MDNYFNGWDALFKKFFDGEVEGKFNQYFKGAENQLRVNLYESKDELLCLFLVPGVKKVEDICLTVNEKMLEVSCDIHFEHSNFRVIQEEFNEGTFTRVINLPFLVRKDRVDASYKRGLLAVRLVRLPPSNENQTISIKDEE
ncbi:Hsp20/alpha crystallin family protein [Pseudobacillus sp. FSL P4-0506]|uniref:Hsp20/alpha crystallin family protein n=1 Tax=unclassified Pseudobacillus TaxID=2619284 RepID=UPI0030F564C6